MSIILDALHTGRGKAAAAATSAPAQTDAVLQTLGYGRNSSSALDRLKRVVVYLGVALLLAGLLGAAVIWLARLYAVRESGGAAFRIARVETPNGKVIFFPDGSIKRP